MPQTLLIVDDEREMRELLRHLLSLRGYYVITAPSGREALALAQANPITAALIDINMPGISGIELCRALHEQAGATGRQTPVWIMTGAYREGMSEAARAAGAQMVLRKPLKVAELCKRFERALQIHLGKTAPVPLPA
jgi:CheY-like chemotaxis protein